MDVSPEREKTLEELRNKPLPSDTVIWHYRNFSEFTAILQNKALWFTRVDRLKDRWEGRSAMPDMPDEIARHEEYLRGLCVSCWTIDEDESDLMWLAYAQQSGVAIRSTAGRLRSCMMHMHMHLMEVPYGSLDTHDPYRKRSLFKREREYRVVFLKPTEKPGFLWKIDLQKLIKDVWVSPHAPDWFAKVVKKQLTQYGLPDIKVFCESAEVHLDEEHQDTEATNPSEIRTS